MLGGGKAEYSHYQKRRAFDLVKPRHFSFLYYLLFVHSSIVSDFLFFGSIVGFCIGIVIGIGADNVWPESGVLLVVAISLAIVSQKNSDSTYVQNIRVVSVLLLLVVIGMCRAATYDAATSAMGNDYVLNQPTLLEGVVSREPEVREKTQQIYVTTDATTVLVYVDRYAQFSYGDTVVVRGKLTKPEVFETDLGRTFNYSNYLLAKGVTHTMAWAKVEVIDSGGGWWILRQLLQVKHLFMDNIEMAIREPMAGLGEGLLLGVKQALGDELETVFRTTGIIHVVVLSGYNVALVVAFISFGLSYVCSYRQRLIFGLLGIVLFALLVGLSATVVRASIMASFIVVAKCIGRTYNVIRGLALAGVVMLLINPYLLLYDVGFQLSFLATFGLIVLVPACLHIFSILPPAKGLREIFFATLSTQIMVLPLLLYQIGEFSVVSIVVNVLVLPMVPVSMLLVFITGIIGFVHSDAAFLVAVIAELSLQYIILVATFFASLPFASFVVPAFSFWVVPLVYISAFVFWLWWRQKSFVTNYLNDWTIEEESVVALRVMQRKK